MKKRTIMALAAVALLATAGLAAAADTATVNVTATVVGTCQFTSAGTTIALGTLPFDASGNASGASANGSIQFQCTTGAAWSITDDDGLNETGSNANRLASTTLPTTEYIPYSLTYTPASGTGAGWSNPQTVTLTASIASGAYTNNSPDAYADTVTLTINP